MHNPDTTNKAVAGSGTVVTVKVPTGVDVPSGKILRTLPEVDKNAPVARGARGNEKKSPGKLLVKRSGWNAPLNNAIPIRVAAGVICNPITEFPGLSPGVPKLKDVTEGAVKPIISSPPGGSKFGNLKSTLNAPTEPFAPKLKL
jgi:hypothetical protein